MAAFRSMSSSLLPEAVATTASDSTSLTVRSGHVHFNGARGSSAISCPRIEKSATLGGVRRPVFDRCSLFGSSSVRQSPLPVPGLSRRYAVAQPYPEGLGMEVEDEVGSEEVVGGCRVRHGELWNEDVRIHYVECGDKNGELVVLIHGFPNFWYVWKNQFQALAEAGYHVVAPDLRGYNTSSKPKDIENYGRCSVVSDMVHLIDELGGGKPATVVGHDWGGFVTWAVAEDFPDKVKKAVIANVPHTSVFSAVVRSSFRQMRRSLYIGFFQLPWLPEWQMGGRGFKGLKVLFSNTTFQPLDIDRHVRAYQNVGALKGAINYYRAAIRGHWSPGPRATIPIELPVDLIWGELDAFLGKELAVIPNTVASNAVIKFLPHCAHWPMWDDPKQFNALLLESLSSQHATSADQVHKSTVSANEDLVA